MMTLLLYAFKFKFHDASRSPSICFMPCGILFELKQLIKVEMYQTVLYKYSYQTCYRPFKNSKTLCLISMNARSGRGGCYHWWWHSSFCFSSNSKFWPLAWDRCLVFWGRWIDCTAVVIRNCTCFSGTIDGGQLCTRGGCDVFLGKNKELYCVKLSQVLSKSFTPQTLVLDTAAVHS